MNSSSEATIFTDTMLSAVRLQRHLGVRIIISTQESTISTSLLNLCSITIVNRFTSPKWLHVIRHHLAAAAQDTITSRGKLTSSQDRSSKDNDAPATLFVQIVRLNVGEALLFTPSAIIGVDDGNDGDDIVFSRLGVDSLAITVRGRLTDDGGKSVLSL
jgi:hypothetical protein